VVDEKDNNVVIDNVDTVVSDCLGPLVVRFVVDTEFKDFVEIVFDTADVGIIEGLDVSNDVPKSADIIGDASSTDIDVESSVESVVDAFAVVILSDVDNVLDTSLVTADNVCNVTEVFVVELLSEVLVDEKVTICRPLFGTVTLELLTASVVLSVETPSAKPFCIAVDRSSLSFTILC
jgi:hypothetical protein